MNSTRLFPAFLLAALLTGVFLLAAAQAADTSTVKFSDPSKPGTIKVVLNHGDLRVQGADTDTVSVVSESSRSQQPARKDGLRVLTAASSFSLSEKDNVVTLDAADGLGHGADFRLTVPRGTSLMVTSSFGGDVDCRGINGDIEIHSMHGDIRLEDVVGSVVVDTVNGELRATIKELKPNKSLSFTSMHGDVVLRVPVDGKANVRLRTQNGAVLTDFDESVLVTRTESAPRSSRRAGGGVLPPEAVEAIRNAARLAVEASREAAEAAREGAEAARERIEAVRERAEAARERAEAARLAMEKGLPEAPIPPTPPTPPKPPTAPRIPMVPTITGGKLVTGTLNGGGPEISVATMNGDVTLRKL